MIAGRYTLEREIGRGGAGVVHLARDEVLGRAVAIKRMGLLPGTTGDDVARAQREARLAAGINHPHVVSILDLVKDDDCYWLVMEHVEGRTLAEIVAAEGALPPTRAAAILAQAADGLVEAHQAGIVHRDVKPSNIMVDDTDRAKLGDFGIARSANDAALTRTGLVTGSPAYLAPEVASGSEATAASDVWSLGATLHHAAMGRAPYDMGQNVLGGLYRIVHDDPPRLPHDHPLAAVLAGMMQKDPEQRWPAARVRDELNRVARGAGAVPADDDATVALATASTPTASTPTSTPTSTATSDEVSAPAPAPAHAPTPAAARASSGRGGLPGGRLVAVMALVLLAGLAAWLLLRDDGAGDTVADTSSSGQTQESQPSGGSSASDQPSETKEPSTGTAPTGDAAAMRAFVQDYFSQVTADPEATYAMLTPQFQAESGGYERYAGFWSTIESATVSDVRADPGTLTTSYTIQYVTTSGRTTTQQGRLRLERSGEGYLIAAEG